LKKGEFLVVSMNGIESIKINQIDGQTRVTAENLIEA
jgi:hypothetical protein